MTKAKRHPALVKVAFCAVLAALCVLFSLNISHGSTKIEKLSDDPYIIVSMGDSYASGEGVEPFYDQELPLLKKTQSQDWIAHRSQNSWAGKLKVPYLDKQLSEYKDKNNYWFFVANSGAKTADILGKKDKDITWKVDWNDSCLTKKYTPLSTSPGLSFLLYEPVKFDPQIQILKDLPKGSVRYVTISIGGNDAQFVDVMTRTMLTSKYLKPLDVITFIKEFYKDGGAKIREIMARLVVTFEKIQEAAGPQATILVAGYPKLLNPEGYLTTTVSKDSPEHDALSGGSSMDKDIEIGIVDVSEAKWVNGAVEDFNRYIKLTVKDLAEKGMNIVFVDVAKYFNGHEAYTDGPGDLFAPYPRGAYINPLYLHGITYNRPETDFRGPYGEDYDQLFPASSYSFHPNIKGIEAYRQAFQDAIDQCEREIYHNISPRFYSDQTNPTPVDPTPVDPTPVDPTPVTPTPVDPTPVEPTPVDPTPVEPEPITAQEVNEFLNGFLSETYHDEEIVFNHTKSDVMLEIPILEDLYDALRAGNSSLGPEELRLTYDSIGINALSAEDQAKLRNSAIFKRPADSYTGSIPVDELSFDYYDLDAVKAVLNKLYGNGRVSLDQFFKGEYIVTTDGRLLLPTWPHGSWSMGHCRYKIRGMEQNGDEVNVTVSCIYVNCDYRPGEEGDPGWEMPVYGTYTVSDLVSDNFQSLASGNDSNLKSDADYEAFADRFSVEGTDAATVVITLFRDADGLHLK